MSGFKSYDWLDGDDDDWVFLLNHQLCCPVGHIPTLYIILKGKQKITDLVLLKPEHIWQVHLEKLYGQGKLCSDSWQIAEYYVILLYLSHSHYA